MNILATIRRAATMATLIIFSACVVMCLGMQPVAAAAQNSGHDCCPRTDAGDSCPRGIAATACSLNSLDLPKASEWNPDLAPLGHLETRTTHAPATTAEAAPDFPPVWDAGDLHLRLGVLRI